MWTPIPPPRDVGGGEVHLADLDPWEVTLVSSVARTMFQMAAIKAVKEGGISAGTHAQVQAKAMMRAAMLLRIAGEGDAGRLEEELAAGGCDVKAVSGVGATLLGEACRSANSDAAACCRLLVSYGADVNAAEGPRCMLPPAASRRSHGLIPLLSRLCMRARPLHVACASGNHAAVRVLLEEGADVHARDAPLSQHDARLAGGVEGAVFLPGGLGHTPFLTACCAGSERCVEAILRGTSVRVEDLEKEGKVERAWHGLKGRGYGGDGTQGGWSAGSTEVTGDSWEWVLDDQGERRGGAWLRHWGRRNAVDRGVIGAVDALGRGCMHWACCAGSDGVVQMLLLAGASAVAKDAGGNTPLLLAAM